MHNFFTFETMAFLSYDHNHNSCHQVKSWSKRSNRQFVKHKFYRTCNENMAQKPLVLMQLSTNEISRSFKNKGSDWTFQSTIYKTEGQKERKFKTNVGCRILHLGSPHTYLREIFGWFYVFSLSCMSMVPINTEDCALKSIFHVKFLPL